MNQLKLATNKKTINSRLVTKMVGKRHGDLTRDIRQYCEYLNESNIALVDFFIESTYKDAKGEIRLCYELTKMGCEMVANKLTGVKGVQFTALYVQKFNEMEQQEQQSKISSSEEAKLLNAQARLENAKTRKADMYLKLSDVDTLSKEYKNILVAQAVEVMSGEKLLPHTKSEQKTYSATELGEMFSISAQKLGAITNKHNLKSDEYGEWYRDKSPYSSKEVDSFRYYDAVIPRLEKILI